MSLLQWAEQECRLACKKENPDFNFDSNGFDYGCSCYKSALKAYKSLTEDGHSGASWGFTKRILERLMDGQPLTPITDEDFFLNQKEDMPHMPSDDEWLKEHGLKSELQCPRMSSLFRREYLDGRIVYQDVNRDYFIDIEDPSNTFSSNSSFLDEMFPITMPYAPVKGKYKIYTQTFLCDEKNGDFDTKGILYVITPEGERVEVGIYMTERNGKMERISKEEYEELLARRIDKVSIKAAKNLLWTLLSNSASDKEIERREAAYRSLLPETKKSIEITLQEKCRVFDNPEIWKYNTFSIRQALCRGENTVPELEDISTFLQGILRVIA